MPALTWTFIKHTLFKKKSKRQGGIEDNGDVSSTHSLEKEEQNNLFAYGTGSGERGSSCCSLNDNQSTSSLQSLAQSDSEEGSLKKENGNNTTKGLRKKLRKQKLREMAFDILDIVLVTLVVIIIGLLFGAIICAILI